MNKAEKVARDLCAFCNFNAKCEDCPHREWPSGKWHKEPRWDYRECKQWVLMLMVHPVGRIGRFLCRIGLHKWYRFKKKDLKKCIRCGVEEEDKVVEYLYVMEYWDLWNKRLM